MEFLARNHCCFETCPLATARDWRSNAALCTKFGNWQGERIGTMNAAFSRVAFSESSRIAFANSAVSAYPGGAGEAAPKQLSRQKPGTHHSKMIRMPIAK
jgi:hypothetical protein